MTDPTACRELTAERRSAIERMLDAWHADERSRWPRGDVDAVVGVALESLAALDAARAKLAEVEAERECRVSNSLTCGFVQTWRDVHAASVVELDRLTGIFGDIIEACDPDADDGPDALTAAKRCAAERDAAVTRAERAEAALVVLRELGAKLSAAVEPARIGGASSWESLLGCDARFRAALAATPEALVAKYEETLLRVASAARENTMAAYPGSVSGHEVIEWRGRVDLERTIELATKETK